MSAAKPGTRNQAAPASPLGMSLDRVRRGIDNPQLDFATKAALAGAWWFEQLSQRVDDPWISAKASRKDRKSAGMLLCVAMDGEQGANDDLAPMLAGLLRPHCPAASFVQGWEQVRQLAPGTVRSTVAKILG